MNAFLLSAFALFASGTVSFREPDVVPKPANVSCRTNVEVRLDVAQTLTVRCPDASAADWARTHLKLWFGFAPKVVAEKVSVGVGAAEPEGAYRLVAKPDGLTVDAASLAGVRYALFTLRQVAERDSSGETISAYRLPELTISDSPRLKFRGLHLCWFPELSADFIERQVRVAAFYKYNVVVIESWGVWRSARHPWFGWPDGPMTKEAIRRLVGVAKDLGVTLVPQINVFGHAAAARSCTGKHATLDFSPERQTLFEPAGTWSGGWNWCLSNPAAVRVLRDLVVELHEDFDNPPYFHIGCDEADEPTCASCRAADYAKLVSGHIAGIADLLRSRGARALIWHDMLLLRGDPRWNGFYANGDLETAKLPQLLPKDSVICDWYYEKPPAGGKYPTLDYFAKTCGFDTLTCPWNDIDGIRAQSKVACEKHLFGVLETVWHHYGAERFPKMVEVAACGAWGRGDVEVNAWSAPASFATLWRQCGWDMGTKSYKEAGWFDNQTTRDILTR